MGFAREVADRVIFMDAGAIVEVGTRSISSPTPTHDRTKLFLSQILWIRVRDSAGSGI
jgi:ABC-type polar amino acid transport system ATPase subunit